MARAIGWIVVGSGCNALSGIGDFDVAPSAMSEDDGGPGDARDGSVRDASDLRDASVDPSAWRFRRSVTLTSDVPDVLTNRPVLVVFPESFAYERVKADGSDLRFASDEAHGDDLPYFVESWTPGKTSFVWVRVPAVPVGTSTVHLFYGNEGASAASQFDPVFPRVRRTAGGGSGSFLASGDIDVDWFELGAGDTLTLAPGVPLKITASRIVVAGTIQGDGAGFAAGPDTSHLSGSGPGGGMTGKLSGGAGGGYGGAGGDGGKDANEGDPSPGGKAYGSEGDPTVELGSGAGSGYYNVFRQGGAGGGAVSLVGWRTTVTGTLSVNGADGAGGGVLSGGGGAGGGALLAANWLDLTGASLRAKGGNGGGCVDSGDDGGGGGGGGRIKLFARASGAFFEAAAVDVGFGQGGSGGGTTAPGKVGNPGSLHVDKAANVAVGVEATLGDEVALN